MGLFDDLIRMFESLTVTTNSYIKDAETAFIRMIPSIESSILAVLVEEAINAMDAIPEYSAPEASPLRRQLIKNLSAREGGRPVHVNVYADGSVYIFDEEYAGTADDFYEAKYPSNSPDRVRYLLWRYGIYAPAVEGEQPTAPWLQKASDKLPSYQEIIHERLSIWENKAPYWHFIAHGNAGGAPGYPTFEGKNFVHSVRTSAREAVRKFYNNFIENWQQEAVDNIQGTITHEAPQKPHSDDIRWVRVTSRSGKIRWQKYSKSAGGFIPGVFYQAED